MNSGKHQINFIPGSLAHFLSLNSEQQQRAVSACELPEISYKGDTAHHYAAVGLIN